MSTLSLTRLAEAMAPAMADMKAVMGLQSCVYSSLMAVELLHRFGLEGQPMACNLVLCRNGCPTLASNLRIGHYDEEHRPKVVSTEIDGFKTAGHVATIVNTSTIIDFALDQMRDVRLPVPLVAEVEGFAHPGAQLVAQIPGRASWSIRYDVIDEDLTTIECARPPTAKVDEFYEYVVAKLGCW